MTVTATTVYKVTYQINSGVAGTEDLGAPAQAIVLATSPSSIGSILAAGLGISQANLVIMGYDDEPSSDGNVYS